LAANQEASRGKITRDLSNLSLPQGKTVKKPTKGGFQVVWGLKRPLELGQFCGGYFTFRYKHSMMLNWAAEFD